MNKFFLVLKKEEKIRLYYFQYKNIYINLGECKDVFEFFRFFNFIIIFDLAGLVIFIY